MVIDSVILTSLIDYPGHIACTIFTSGCNYNCWYCHNNKLITQVENKVDETDLLDKLKQRKDFLDGLVICGGEPTLQEDLEQFIVKVRALGYKVKLDTNGTNPQVIKSLLGKNLLDYVAMDIKAPFDKYESVLGGKVDISKIKSSIELLKGCGVDYEFRTTFSPDLSLDDIREIAKSIKGSSRYFIQQYVPPVHLGKDAPKPHSKEILSEAAINANGYVPTHVRG